MTKLVTIHDLNAVRNTAWVTPDWHERRSAKLAAAIARADHVMTYSEFTANEIREHYGFPAERVHPLLLGVDTRRFRPLPPAAIEQTRKEYGDYALAIGVLTPRKNFPRLIEAVARIPELRLVLVGRGSDGRDPVEAALDRTRMRGRTDRLERIGERELVALIGGARVCAVPSLYEGFGLTVLEAMACGTPVVCSDAASLPEVASDAALYVDARSSGALEQGLRRVLFDDSFADDLRRRGLGRAHAMSWQASARRLRALYREIAGV